MVAMTQDERAPDLLTLIDQLEALLNASELSELELEVGEIGLVLRKAIALEQSAAGRAGSPSVAADTPVEAAVEGPASSARAVVAPLTGLFYTAPSPGAEPYVREGGQVAVGQVIGLIEAMKLFNEIKSDVAGRIVRLCAVNGALVKAKEPLLEVEP
jgi:acetyl-CoA carboxylase biotin carboxyl carrier protein